MKKVITLLILFQFLHVVAVGTIAKLNKEQNLVEFTTDLEVSNQKNKKKSSQCCTVFTPLSPYNTISCIITAPRKVCVDQPFMVDFSLVVKAPIYLSFWADLMPTQEQMIAQGLVLVDYTEPTVGMFQPFEESVAHKGGRGTWRFDQGIPAGTYNIRFTYIAHKPGMKSYTSLLATNPPAYIEVMDIVSVDEAPSALNDFMKTYCTEPVVIPVLDNDYGHSALQIKSVTKPGHGMVLINADNTLTYTSLDNFEGTDSFEYIVIDGAGNEAKAVVEVEVCRRPIAPIAIK